MSRGLRTASRVRRAFLAVFGLAIPLGSRIFGDGTFAYGMYASAVETRLEVVAIDVAGNRHALSPAELARGARPSVVPMVAGSDHFRVVPGSEGLRAALPALARHACSAVETTPSVAVVELTLFERRHGGELRETRARETCP